MRLERREGQRQVSGHLDARPEVGGVAPRAERSRRYNGVYNPRVLVEYGGGISRSFPFISNTPSRWILYSARKVFAIKSLDFEDDCFDTRLREYFLTSILSWNVKCSSYSFIAFLNFAFWYLPIGTRRNNNENMRSLVFFFFLLKKNNFFNYEATFPFHESRNKTKECQKQLGETADKFLLSILRSRDRSFGKTICSAGNAGVISWANGSYHFSFLTELNSNEMRRGRGNSSTF